MNIVKRLWRDATNWRYIGRTIERQRESLEWRTYNLRSDWVRRIYTVVEMPDEFAQNMTDPEIVGLIIDRLKPVNAYLTRLDLHEIVHPGVERIRAKVNDPDTGRAVRQDTDYWLVTYTPIFRGFTRSLLWWMISLAAIGCAIKYALYLGIV